MKLSLALASAAMLSLASFAQAATVTGCQGPNNCPGATLEFDVFLNGNAGPVNQIAGQLGSQQGLPGLPTASFSSTNAIEASQGYADIRPDTNGGSFTNLTASLLGGATFEDLIFAVQGPPGNNSLSFNVFADFAGDAAGNVLLTPTAITQGAGTNFYIALDADLGSSFASIFIQAVSGDFRSLGQFSFSELRGPGGGVINPTGPGVVPVPGAALLMGTALAGVGGFGAWRRRRRETSARRDAAGGNVLHC
jgi:hypothetical protein